MIPIKQCLNAVIVKGPAECDLSPDMRQLVMDELNVLEFRYEYAPELSIELDTDQNEEALRRTEERQKSRAEAVERKRLGLIQGQ